MCMYDAEATEAATARVRCAAAKKYAHAVQRKQLQKPPNVWCMLAHQLPPAVMDAWEEAHDGAPWLPPAFHLSLPPAAEPAAAEAAAPEAAAPEAAVPAAAKAEARKPTVRLEAEGGGAEGGGAKGGGAEGAEVIKYDLQAMICFTQSTLAHASAGSGHLTLAFRLPPMHRAAAAAAAVADDLATAAAAAADAAAAAATDGDGAAAASAAAAAVVAGAVAGEVAVEAEVEQVLTEAVEQVASEAVAATAAAAGEGEGGEGEGEAGGGGEGESGAKSDAKSGGGAAVEARRRRLSHAALLPAEMATRWGAAEAQGGQWYVWNDFALATATEAEVLSLHAEWRRPCVLVYVRGGLSERLSQLPLDAPELASRSMTGAFSLQQPPTVVPPERARAITPLAAHELPPKAGQLVAIDAEFVAVTHELTRPGKTAGKTIVVKPARLSLARVSILRGSGTMAGVPFIDAYVQQACAVHRLLHLCMYDLRHLACAAAPHAHLHAHPHAHLHKRCTGRAGGRLPDTLLGAAPGRPRSVGLAPPHHHDEGGLPAAAPAGRRRLPLRRPRAAEGLRDDQRRRAARPDRRHGRPLLPARLPPHLAALPRVAPAWAADVQPAAGHARLDRGRAHCLAALRKIPRALRQGHAAGDHQ